jgi:hypothetical protein
VAVEQLIGGHVIQSGHIFTVASLTEHPPDYEIDHHPAHLPQEFEDAHHLGRRLAFLTTGVGVAVSPGAEVFVVGGSGVSLGGKVGNPA